MECKVHFVVKRRWFDDIASIHKRIEYRLNTPYWRTRLLGKEGCLAVFHRGYSATTLTFRILAIVQTTTMILVYLGDKIDE